MIIDEAWKNFALSGKINDYLKYVEVKDLEKNDKEQNSVERGCIGNTGHERG